MTSTRRSLITGIGAILCAPAIVRASSLMPISVYAPFDFTASWWEKIEGSEEWVYYATIGGVRTPVRRLQARERTHS